GSRDPSEEQLDARRLLAQHAGPQHPRRRGGGRCAAYRSGLLEARVGSAPAEGERRGAGERHVREEQTAVAPSGDGRVANQRRATEELPLRGGEAAEFDRACRGVADGELLAAGEVKRERSERSCSPPF